MSLEYYYGKKIKSDLSKIPVTIINKPNDEKVVFGTRYEAENLKESKAFFEGSAIAYEIYIICSKDGIIEEINHRVEPCQRENCRSFAPNNAPAWIFPKNALFDLEWDDIAYVCRKKMIKLLDDMIEETTPNKKAK